MVNPSQSEVDQIVYSLDPDYEQQRREVREFWDLFLERRRAAQAAKRAAAIARAAASLRSTPGVVGIILFGGSVLYLIHEMFR